MRSSRTNGAVPIRARSGRPREMRSYKASRTVVSIANPVAGAVCGLDHGAKDRPALNAVSAASHRQVCSAGRSDGRAGTGVSGLTVSQEQRAQASSPDATEATNASRALPQRISLAILFFAYWCVDIVSPALPAIQVTGAECYQRGTRFLSVLRGATHCQSARRMAGRASRAEMDRSRRIRRAHAWFGPRGGGRFGDNAASGTWHPGCGVALLATAGLLSVLRARPGGGAAMTAFNLSTGAGGSAGLLSGGYLTGEFGWRAVFWLSTVVSGFCWLARCWPGCERRSRGPGALPGKKKA